MSTRRTLFLILIAFVMSGCLHRPIASSEPDALDFAQVKLAEAATSVSSSLAKLAEIEAARYPHARLPTPQDPQRIGLGQLASVDWSGPIEPLVRKISRASNYRVRVLGRRPAIPVIVTVYQHNTPVGDILRDVRFQAHKKVVLKTYPKTRTIELRYLQ